MQDDERAQVRMDLGGTDGPDERTRRMGLGSLAVRALPSGESLFGGGLRPRPARWLPAQADAPRLRGQPRAEASLRDAQPGV